MGEKRDVHINMMFTESEYLKLKEMAEDHKTTLTGFVRQAIREKMLLEGQYFLKIAGKYRQIGGVL